MFFGGISIKATKLTMSILALGLMLIAYGSAIDYENPEGGPSPNYAFDSPQQHDGQQYHDGSSYHHEYDWLSPGGYYNSWYYYPTTYYYDWYYTPAYTYTYYPTYYYTTPVYYTAPTYYSTPVVYYDWIDPWWATNVYGYGSVTHYSSSSWTYHSGYGYP